VTVTVDCIPAIKTIFEKTACLVHVDLLIGIGLKPLNDADADVICSCTVSRVPSTCRMNCVVGRSIMASAVCSLQIFRHGRFIVNCCSAYLVKSSN